MEGNSEEDKLVKSTLDDIIQKLSSSKLEIECEGIEDLDKLLFQWLPQIIFYQKNLNNLRSPSKQHCKSTNNISKTCKELLIFIELQDFLEYNLMNHILNYLRNVLKNLQEAISETFFTAHSLIQGILLLHPKSRHLFRVSSNMDTVLAFLKFPSDESKSRNTIFTNTNDAEKKISIEAAITLVTTLIHVLTNDFHCFRTFEQCNGCTILIKHFFVDASIFNIHKSISSPSVDVSSECIYRFQDLNFKLIEFLIFYYHEEEYETESRFEIKTDAEKSDMFRPNFPYIDNLIENFNKLS